MFVAAALALGVAASNVQGESTGAAKNIVLVHGALVD